MNNFLQNGAEQVSTPNNLNTEAAPVQNFAFGGIANPSQRVFLNTSDREYLEARQAELDKYEQERQAYNNALTTWQNEVYNPYKAQVDAYNAASTKYNEEVYNPYKSQVDAYNAALAKYNEEVYNPYVAQYQAYEKAVNDWNAGPRESDYAGPAAPTLARTFDMAQPTAPNPFSLTAPTAPKDFSMAAPSLPFNEADITAYQQEAAERAKKAAQGRAVAIDVVSDPDRFNFGAMGISKRFMAEGGPVDKDTQGGDYSRTAQSIVKDFQGYGYTPEEIQDLAGQVANAGRGGDELLAYLSPESMQFLKSHGGSGTINPVTGLPEFKGGVIGAIVNAVKSVFGGGRDDRRAPDEPAVPDPEAPAATAAPAPAPAPAAPQAPVPTAAELMEQLRVANEEKAAAKAKYDLDLKMQQEAAAKAQQEAIDAALKADADRRAALVAAPIIGTPAAPATSLSAMAVQPASQPAARSATLTPEIARDLMIRSMTTGAPTSEFDKYGGYNAVAAMYNQQGGTYDLSSVPKTQLQNLAQTVGQTGVGNLSVLGMTDTPLTQAGYQNMLNNGIDPSTAAAALKQFGTIKAKPSTNLTALPSSMSGASANWSRMPSLSGSGSSALAPYSGVQPVDVSRFLSAKPIGWDQYRPRQPGAANQGQSGSTTTPSGGTTTPLQSSPVPSIADYSSRGVGTALANVAMPNFNIGQAREYVSPNNPSISMFARPGNTNPGLTPGTVALGPADLPMPGALNTLGRLGANSNLSPGMLGGMQNAGMMTDRLGNRIYAPGAMPLFGINPPPGFAKGGLADVNAYNLSDDDEPINTNPVGTAQQFLADLSATVSPNEQSAKRAMRTSPMPKGGGAARPKSASMQMEELAQGDLGAMKDYTPKAKDTDSARAQLEEMARQYTLKAQMAKTKAKGLAADTFGAPTLEGPTLTKNKLARKRFKDGGEAKKADAEGKEPGLFGVTSYATRASERMFPGQLGQDDQRDAARHLLAAGMVARKTSPGVANFLGKAHERMSNPESFFSMFGIGNPRDDYEMDVHNNRLGAELASRAKSQAELEKLVEAMARQSQTKQTEGKPWIMSREQMQARKDKAAKGMTPPPEYAEGGEVSAEELEAASKPAFVTPKAGKGRKRGPISEALNSGSAYVNMAKGATELPYDIVGAPVDLATMALRPLGYRTEKPVMGSEWIKEKMTSAGVRPEPPSDPTAKGFYTAGELLSNLTNPAGVARKVGPAVEKGVKAGAKEVGRQLDRAIMDNAGPLAGMVPQAARPLYAVRPTGSTMLTGSVGFESDVSGVDKILREGLSNVRSAAGQNDEQAKILSDFWDKKARNYFTRQFGTPDDPVADAIAKQRIKGSALEETFPKYMLDQITAGKTRVNEQGQERFFPKYPRAMEDFQQRYDTATGLRGNIIGLEPGLGHPEYTYSMSDAGRALQQMVKTKEEDRLLGQGVRPELINANVGLATRSGKIPERVIGEGTPSAEALLKAYEEAQAYSKMPMSEQLAWADKQFGEGRKLHGMLPEDVGPGILAQNVKTALDKGEPVYDISNMGSPLSKLFRPSAINEYLASLPPREAANVRFEDAVRGALKMGEDQAQLDVLVSRIKAGKPVADSVFSKGVSAPLLQFKEGPLEGFAWKRIEDRKATVPEGAYVGHSVGGYELGGPTYTTEKRDGFNTGKYQIYTLRDNRNRPVNTIEVKMLDENTPVVTQIKGNGRATGNTAPEKYDAAVLEFLQGYLRPAMITESDSYLTPLLQTYKNALTPSAAR